MPSTIYPHPERDPELGEGEQSKDARSTCSHVRTRVHSAGWLLSRANSRATSASWAASSARAADGLQRPRIRKTVAIKTTIPATQIQYQVCHSPGAAAAAALISPSAASSSGLGFTCWATVFLKAARTP